VKTTKPKNPRFEVYPGKTTMLGVLKPGDVIAPRGVDGSWRWRLYARNGEIVASGEGYTTERDARKGVKAVQRAVRAIEDREDAAAGIERLPVAKAKR
jgi:uncharacterized protein YegP (UPF0339 family)